MLCFLARSMAKASFLLQIKTLSSAHFIVRASIASIMAWKLVPPPDASTPILSVCFCSIILVLQDCRFSSFSLFSL